MTGQRDSHTQVHDEKASEMLGDRIRLMFISCSSHRSHPNTAFSLVSL